MKLNKRQVEAIASKIKKNIVDPINKYNNEIRNSEEYVNFEKNNNDCAYLSMIADKYSVNHSINQIISKIKNDYFKDKFLVVPYFGYDNCDIINDIILGTIEYDNLDELIDNLSKKYANA